MRVARFSHLNAANVIPTAVLQETQLALQGIVAEECKTVPKLKAEIMQEMTKCGWSKKVRVSLDSNITITGRLSDVGLCVQTGNMGRFYADLLKLQAMFQRKALVAAVYVIPCRAYGRTLSSNIADYERLTEELAIFSTIITIPISVFGLGG